MRWSASIVAITLAAALSTAFVGCGGSGSLSSDVGLAVGDYQVLDLSTGTIETRSAIADLTSNAAYRTTKIVFRAITGGTTSIGSSNGSFGHQADESMTQASLGRYYIAVFELTQAQWWLLAGSTPWTAIPGSLGGNSDLATYGERAALGVAYDDALAEIASYNAGRTVQLALPTAAQWEYACRAGTASLFSWGDQLDDPTIALHAVVAETAGGTTGPRVVGQRQANAFGLYDAHGNVWEWTSGGSIRGGSWLDTAPLARSANAIALDSVIQHPLVGLRLVLVP